MEALKEELRVAIRASGLSDQEVVRRLGYAPSYLANLLGTIKGREPAGLRVDTWFSLMQVLDLDAEVVLKRALARVGRDLDPALQRRSRAELLSAEAGRILEELASLVTDDTTLRGSEVREMLHSSLTLTRSVAEAVGRSGEAQGLPEFG